MEPILSQQYALESQLAALHISDEKLSQKIVVTDTMSEKRQSKSTSGAQERSRADVFDTNDCKHTKQCT